MKILKNVLVFSFLIFLGAVSTNSAYAAPRKALSDINRDKVISQLDLDILSPLFGSTNPVGKNALSDINQDGKINILDLVAVAGKIGLMVSACEMADINNNGTVDRADLDTIGFYFGQTDNSTNMMADLTGDGEINILDLSKASGLYGCSWITPTPVRRPPPASPFM